MDYSTLKKLRIKQLLLLNGLSLSGFTVFFIIINTSGISLKWLFTIIPIILLLQTGVGLFRWNSTRTLIPIMDEIIQYEKQKMGNEWKKQQRVAAIINLLVAAAMFFIAFNQPPSRPQPLSVSALDFSMIFVFTILIINFSSIMHIRRVDRSSAPAELKGYAVKTTIMAVLAGIGLAVAIILLSFFSVVSKI
jgi:hypothetical protein